MANRIKHLELKKYNPTKWYDNLVEFPDRYKIEHILDEEGNKTGLAIIKENEGEVYEEGTGLEERIMNNIEQGILNNNTYILTAIQDIKDIQLQVLILQATVTGDVNGDVYVDNLDDVKNITLNRGIYDEAEKTIYCMDSEGEKIEVTGYAIAIG